MAPKQNHCPPMPVNLSVKNVPDDLAERLRRRAARAHRSLQGELMAILEAAVREDEAPTPAEALEGVGRRGLAAGDEAATRLRRARDRGLQVLLEGEELDEIRRIARRHRLTVAEWVRRSLRSARAEDLSADVETRRRVLARAVAHAFPTADIDRMLAEIERGYAGPES